MGDPAVHALFSIGCVGYMSTSLGAPRWGATSAASWASALEGARAPAAGLAPAHVA